MKIYELLIEADPIDFGEFKKRKEAPKIPDSLRYAAAKHNQEETPPTTLSDVARGIILRNLDKVFSGQPLPDEDRAQLRTIIRATDMINRMKRHDLVYKVINLYNKANPEKKLTYHRANAGDAYIKDDPNLAKWQLTIGGKTMIFDNSNAFNLYVLTNLLKDTASWPEEDQTENLKMLSNISLIRLMKMRKKKNHLILWQNQNIQTI